MPLLSPAFVASPQFAALSTEARAALAGMLQFVMGSRGEWTVEGSAGQIAGWVGEESGLGHKAIVKGLAELEAAKLLRRGYGRPATFNISAPLVG